MESPKTPLRSLVKPRTRSMPLRLSTSAMKRGAVSSLAKPPPRPLLMTSLCRLFSLSSGSHFFNELCSRNITIQNSPGFVSRNDPAYTNLPIDSRKPPAPIDPSSMCSISPFPVQSTHHRSSLQVVLHFVCPGLNKNANRELDICLEVVGLFGVSRDCYTTLLNLRRATYYCVN